MSKYYNPQRTRNIFDPDSNLPYKLSRTRLDLFIECPRCFYIDRRLGSDRPPGYPFNLNSAVDHLLKKEFDIHRTKKTSHPLMKSYGLNLVPFQHEKMDEWRDALGGGMQYLHKETNLIITGAVDDIWIDDGQMLFIVDYKATSKDSEITLDADWQIGYKRQMEIYQWLFRRAEFKVSNTGYFVYCNGDKDKEAFDSKLEFDVRILSYEGNDSWVEQVIVNAHKCLMGNQLPSAGNDCDFCKYRDTVTKHEKTKGIL